MEVRVRRIVMAMASRSAMLFGGRKRASQEMIRYTVEVRYVWIRWYLRIMDAG
jgi:hypothetical protein